MSFEMEIFLYIYLSNRVEAVLIVDSVVTNSYLGMAPLEKVLFKMLVQMQCMCTTVPPWRGQKTCLGGPVNTYELLFITSAWLGR